MKEVRVGKSDKCYSEVTVFLKQLLGIKNIHRLFDLSEAQRQELFFTVLKNVEITPQQLAKYLRITIVGVG